MNIYVICYVGGLAVWAVSCSPSFSHERNRHRGESLLLNTPSISDDGEILVFDRPPGDVWRMNISRNELVPVIQTTNVDFRPVLSPAGDKIAFTRDTEGFQHVWMADLSGANTLQVTHGTILEQAHRWVTEKEIITIRTAWPLAGLLPNRALFRVDISRPRGPPRKLGPYAAIAPDGRLAIEERYKSKVNELWLVELATKKTTKIAHGSSASFSEDATRVVFISVDAGFTPHLMVASLSGGTVEELPVEPGPKTAPQFCLRGTAIIYRTLPSERFGAGGIHLLSLSNKTTRTLWREREQ